MSDPAEIRCGLSPEIGPAPEILILGSFPSEMSLARGEYYANPRNRFWTILEQRTGVPARHSYHLRIAGLKTHRIALWDVVRCCFRKGSSDAQIFLEEVNDIPELLKDYPSIRAIGLNGKTAERIFVRSFGNHPMLQSRAVLVLPSTSPANARIPQEEKCRLWGRLLKHSGKTGLP